MAHPAGSGSAGVWRRTEALATRTPSQVDEQLERGRWVRLFRGVYVEATGDVSVGQRELAAVLATCPLGMPAELDGRPTAFACLRSAARVWGLPLIDDDDPSTGHQEYLLHDVGTDRNLGARSRPDAEGRAIVRHRLTIAPQDLVRLRQGLWLTSPLRTALDCAAALPLPAAVAVLDHGLRTTLFSTDELRAGLAQRRRWPGVTAAAAAVAMADGRAESPAESVARVLLLPHLPGLVPQHRITDERGRVVARVDLADLGRRLAIEVDGKRWHAGAQMVAKDRARDRLLERLDWRTERITWHELRAEPEALVARVLERAALLEQRAA
jgi:hypothetical protein